MLKLHPCRQDDHSRQDDQMGRQSHVFLGGPRRCEHLPAKTSRALTGHHITHLQASSGCSSLHDSASSPSNPCNSRTPAGSTYLARSNYASHTIHPTCSTYLAYTNGTAQAAYTMRNTCKTYLAYETHANETSTARTCYPTACMSAFGGLPR